MKAINNALAGTLESSDIQIIIEPKEEAGIEIELKSTVEKQFGRQIRNLIQETLKGLEMDNIKVIATDKGALDCTIKARVQCAAHRAAGVKEKYNWEAME